MISIDITYNGQRFESINDALNKAMADGIKNMIIEKLKPFESEINKAGGQISINIPKDFKDIDFKVTGITQELKDKIISALN